MAEEFCTKRFHPERYLNTHQIPVFRGGYKKFFSEDREYTESSGGFYEFHTGFGKTITSICTAVLSRNKLSKKERKSMNCILIVCKPGLISTWEDDIKKLNKMIKAYNKKIDEEDLEEEKDDKIEYYIARKDNGFSKNDANKENFSENDLVITGDTDISEEYKAEIADNFESKDEGSKTFARNFQASKDYTCFYRKKWAFIIVDEFHEFMNLKSANKAKVVCSLPGYRKLGLSGTLLEGLNAEKALALVTFINDSTFPILESEMAKELRSKKSEGLQKIVYKVTEKESGIIVKYKKSVVTVKMNEAEAAVYRVFEYIISVVATRKMLAKREKDKGRIGEGDKTIKVLSNMILVLVNTYIRQCLICPVVFLTSLYFKGLQMDDEKENDEPDLRSMINAKLREQNIYDKFNTREAIVSSRMRKAMELAMEGKNRKVIIFTCYRTVIDILLSAYSDSNIRIETFKDAKGRQELIDELREEDEFILILTYSIASVGLNLQFANKVICMDNDFRSQSLTQSIARVVRQGNLNKNIQVYLMCSDTYLEHKILEKQTAKKKIGDEVLKGAIKQKVPKIDSAVLCEYVVQGSSLEEMKRNMVDTQNFEPTADQLRIQEEMRRIKEEIEKDNEDNEEEPKEKKKAMSDSESSDGENYSSDESNN